MKAPWIKSLTHPGVHYRIHPDGQFELLGSIHNSAFLGELAHEIRREFYVARALQPASFTPPGQQFDLFPLAARNRGRLKTIPVLRRADKSA